MWIFQKWSVLPHYSHLFQKNTHARLPKNVYQLNELSGGISDFDSKHGTPNKVVGHLSHFSSKFHNILALTLKKVWHNPPFSLNFALFFISLIFKHCHTQNGAWCQGFENKLFLFWSSRYYIKLPMHMYIILMRLFNNWPQRPSFVTSASIW